MFEMSSNFDPEEIKRQAMDAAHEELAEATADKAMEQGVSTLNDVESLTFDLSADSSSIDVARVERRAREILRSRLQ